MSEWLLLVDAEDIKVGNYINVESEDGSTSKMKLIRYSDKYVQLKSKTGEIIKFSAESLESKEEDLLIVGKA